MARKKALRTGSHPAVSRVSKSQDAAGDAFRAAAKAEGTKYDRGWNEFQRLYDGHPALKEDMIYALPERLVDSICEIMPGFLTDEDEEFERTLAKIAGVGIFLGHQILHPLFPGNENSVSDSESLSTTGKRLRKSTEQIQELLSEEMRRRDLSEADIKNYFAKEEKLKQEVQNRQLGYLGWLVTSMDFHRSRNDFRNRWYDKIKELRRFPKFPISLMGESIGSVPEADREFNADWMQFYRHWGLDTFSSWELPVPMRPGLTLPSLYPLSQVGEAGVVLFVPWYLLRDKDITLRDIAEHKQLLRLPQHLIPWVEGLPKNWGPDRYRLMLELYVYLELCLKRRYLGRLKRRQEALDLALSHFYCDKRGHVATGRKEETIRKIRQALNRRVKIFAEMDE